VFEEGNLKRLIELSGLGKNLFTGQLVINFIQGECC
jgi:hypothetical protein